MDPVKCAQPRTKQPTQGPQAQILSNQLRVQKYSNRKQTSGTMPMLRTTVFVQSAQVPGGNFGNKAY
jgi:hypothetical protein